MVLAVSLTPQGRTFRSLWQNGILSAVISGEDPMRAYNATRSGNLKALYTALMLYHDSEDRFPSAEGWMDAIDPRLKANDLSHEEANKKLHRPGFRGYGYALNDAVAGKYKGDLKDPQIPLIFETADPRRNSHGLPIGKKGMTVTVSGLIRQL